MPGRFRRGLEEIAGDMVDDAFLADVATARRVSIRTHGNLPGSILQRRSAIPARARPIAGIPAYLPVCAV